MHAAFMDALVADGFILLGGPLDHGAHTAQVVSAGSEEAVRVRLAEDPWASSGMLTIESVRPWRIWLGAERVRRLGPGGEEGAGQ